MICCRVACTGSRPTFAARRRATLLHGVAGRSPFAGFDGGGSGNSLLAFTASCLRFGHLRRRTIGRLRPGRHHRDDVGRGHIDGLRCSSTGHGNIDRLHRNTTGHGNIDRLHRNTTGQRNINRLHRNSPGGRHDVGICNLLTSRHRNAMGHRRDFLRHRALCRFRMCRRARPFPRTEPVQRRLPPGGHIVRDIDRCIGLRPRFVANRNRRAFARLQHRIAEQVERSLVPRRVGGRRTAGPRRRPRGRTPRGSSRALAGTGRRTI
ncbi:hypothetical protein [Burkholderia cepacia]|uniref:hypothetical protein n=1 Tax=Burkholderia cepacia TaxID=292 RepID=UPI0010682F0B